MNDLSLNHYKMNEKTQNIYTKSNKKNAFYYFSLKLHFQIEDTKTYNTSLLYKDNDCYCCKNYIIIHPKYQYRFIEKYNKNKIYPKRLQCSNPFPKIQNSIIDFGLCLKSEINKPTLRPSPKYIKLLYRLRPELFIYLHRTNYKYIDSLTFHKNINVESYKLLFENYFYQTGQYNDYINCSICLRKYCNMHYNMNNFYNKKCNYCKKHWTLCSWCKYDHLSENIDFYNNICDEETLCLCFHKLFV